MRTDYPLDSQGNSLESLEERATHTGDETVDDVADEVRTVDVRDVGSRADRREPDRHDDDRERGPDDDSVDQATNEELADTLDRDRSTVNRSLATLTERGLVRRDRRLLDGGSYVYQYTAIALPEAKGMLYEALDAWTETVHDVIDEFDGERPEQWP